MAVRERMRTRRCAGIVDALPLQPPIAKTQRSAAFKDLSNSHLCRRFAVSAAAMRYQGSPSDQSRRTVAAACLRHVRITRHEANEITNTPCLRGRSVITVDGRTSPALQRLDAAHAQRIRGRNGRKECKMKGRRPVSTRVLRF